MGRSSCQSRLCCRQVITASEWLSETEAPHGAGGAPKKETQSETPARRVKKLGGGGYGGCVAPHNVMRE